MAGKSEYIPSFVDSLTAEIKNRSGEGKGWQFDTIFLGGGTPSLLNPVQLRQIISALRENYDLSDVDEFTIEANPGTVGLEKLAEFKSLGVNRISIGIQSFDDKNLKFLTRIHNGREALAALANARKAGFENISCDLIYGLPGQSWEDWEKDLRKALNFDPQHLSCYTLTVEPETGLHDLVARKKVIIPQDDGVADMFLRTSDYLANNGYEKYEISNFSRPEKECRHNLHYWRIEPYLGFGPSAHSFDGNKRSWNTASYSEYINSMNSGKPVTAGSENLTDLEMANEMIGFGLRMANGINVDDIPGSHREKFLNGIEKNLKKWGNNINYSGNRIRLTDKGLVWADAIAVDMMLDN